MYKSRRQALGQHFLANEGVLRKIVAAIDPGPEDVIVEIGPGKGVLTAALAAKAGRAIAVEKDERLIPALREAMPANVEIVPGDFLRTDLRGSWRRPAFRCPPRRNIPYLISSPLLFRVLDERLLLSDCVFLLQKEVAERVTAGPGTKSYAPLGILLQNEYEAGVAFTVAPGSFSPPPKVQSALLTLRRRPVPSTPARPKSRTGLSSGRVRRAAQDALEEPGPPRDPGRARGRLCRSRPLPEGPRGGIVRGLFFALYQTLRPRPSWPALF